jgi:hypothetical protein
MVPKPLFVVAQMQLLDQHVMCRKLTLELCQITSLTVPMPSSTSKCFWTGHAGVETSDEITIYASLPFVGWSCLCSQGIHRPTVHQQDM